MFGFINRNQPHPIDLPIKEVMDEMERVGPNDEKFPKLVVQLDRLMEMKRDDRRHTISPDTLVVVAGNLLGILLIVAYEQKHVMTSKAMQFTLKTNPQINN